MMPEEGHATSHLVNKLVSTSLCLQNHLSDKGGIQNNLRAAGLCSEVIPVLFFAAGNKSLPALLKENKTKTVSPAFDRDKYLLKT
jgi:hypothetical protein